MKEQMISMRLANKLRRIASRMCEEHGGLNFTEYVEGLVLLDAALVGIKSIRTSFASIKSARAVSDEELPRWVLYDFPLADFRDAIKRMKDGRMRIKEKPGI
jgi:hypothetical protein